MRPEILVPSGQVTVIFFASENILSIDSLKAIFE